MKEIIDFVDRFVDLSEQFLKYLYSYSNIAKWILRIAFFMYVADLFIAFAIVHTNVVWFILWVLFVLFLIMIRKDPKIEDPISSMAIWGVIAIIVLIPTMIWPLFGLVGVIILVSLYDSLYKKIKQPPLDRLDQWITFHRKAIWEYFRLLFCALDFITTKIIFWMYLSHLSLMETFYDINKFKPGKWILRFPISFARIDNAQTAKMYFEGYIPHITPAKI